MNSQKILGAVLRTDLNSFIDAAFPIVTGERYIPCWATQALAHQLEQVFEGKVRRLLICMPPRTMKSFSVSVAFPAWALGHNPSLKFITASYGADLSTRHMLDMRLLMQSALYRRLWPGTRLSHKQNNDTIVRTTCNGGRHATSVGGTLTGFGADIIAIDDPLKGIAATSAAEKERVWKWFTGTVISRLNNQNTGAIIVVIQRFAIDDLAGRLLEQGGWKYIRIPQIETELTRYAIGNGKFHVRQPGDLINPALADQEPLDEIRRTIGTYNWLAQYQQAPMPPEGNLIRREWLKSYEVTPKREYFELLIQSWDTAYNTGANNDYSVCTTWGVRGDQYYLLDVVRFKAAYPQLKRRVIAEHRRFEPHRIVVENAGNGTTLVQELRGSLPVLGMLARYDKQARVEQQSALIEEGRVLLPKQAPWLEDFLQELLGFPHAPNDDQVDSLTQALRWMTQFRLRPPRRSTGREIRRSSSAPRLSNRDLVNSFRSRW